MKILQEIRNSQNPDILKIRKTRFSGVPLIYWTKVSATSFYCWCTSIDFDCKPPLFQSKYWITKGNTFTALWLIVSVATPQYNTVLFFNTCITFSIALGAIHKVASVFVRTVQNLQVTSESWNNVLNRKEVQPTLS